MLKKNLQSFVLLSVLIGITGFFIFAITDKKDPDRDYRSAFQRHYRIFSPELPEQADFAGEKTPLNIFYVSESLDREIMAYTFMHSSTQQMFKRAQRYFPVIEPILKRHKIPDDFKYLAVAESNLGNVVSPSGAEGMWQFLPATGRHYGLEVNADIDERYNLEKATEAACRYIREAYDTFGTWTLAAASYNRGMDGLTQALKSQQVKNYYDLYLNDETSRYIYRILAAKEIFNHPTRYGFFLKESDFYPPIETYTVIVDSTIPDLPGFALRQGLNYRILREFNPWIHSYILPNKSRRRYILTLPKEGAMEISARKKQLQDMETFFHDTTKINELH